VTEPAATGPSPAVIGPDGALPRAGQVVRRVLLRRNIVIDTETAQLVAAAVQAALQADAPGSPGRHLASAITPRPFWHIRVALQYGCLRSRKAVTPIKSPVPSPAPGAGYRSPALPPVGRAS